MFHGIPKYMDLDTSETACAQSKKLICRNLLDLVQWSEENVSKNHTGTSMYAPVETTTTVMT